MADASNVEVFLTYSSVTEDDVRGATVVVIDVLRACSTIATALHHGARAVLPVADMAEAGKIAANLDPDMYRLGGERNAEKIEGYHLGNSPLEYTQDEVEGRDVILNTTNGTRALSRAKTAKHLLAGSFLNASRVVDFLKQVETPIVIICAGRQNRLSLEDTICAGVLLDRLWENDDPGLVSDAAHTAVTLYHHDRDDVEDALKRANHAQRLMRNGYTEDVAYCFAIDAVPVLPYYRDNRLVLADSLSPAPLAASDDSADAPSL
ncbi:2-phosphosulfolactate phosphatase [Salisaeta longa]|uniref:2-phosphosulfolactate phosphatase n=1 Tax=Salisaeta longa TaxID=503170 RepID=UPI0003B2F93A|nr:2-phosphosulfolactate phosphatase [Salisaeta longa]